MNGLTDIYEARRLDNNESITGVELTNTLQQYKSAPRVRKEDRLWLWSNFEWVEVATDSITIHKPIIQGTNLSLTEIEF